MTLKDLKITNVCLRITVKYIPNNMQTHHVFKVEEGRIPSMLWIIYTFSVNMCCAILSHSVMSDSLWPCGLWTARLLCPWGFSRQEYWSGLPCPAPGDLPDPGMEPTQVSGVADGCFFFTFQPPGKPLQLNMHVPIRLSDWTELNWTDSLKSQESSKEVWENREQGEVVNR